MIDSQYARTHLRYFNVCFMMLLSIMGGTSVGAEPTSEHLKNITPESLQPWIPWVLEGHEAVRCPIAHNNDHRLCAWPGQLELSVNKQGATFTQSWVIYAKSWVALPGNKKVWPLNVSVNQAAGLVSERKGLPHIQLTPGEYQIKGEFTWLQRPKGLRVPSHTGLINLTIDGVNRPNPIRGLKEMLWFGDAARKDAVGQSTKDMVQLKVFRKLSDQFPIRLETVLQMSISGREREITTGQWLLSGFEPISVTSPLPVRIDNNGQLTIQARAGRWEVNMSARATGQPVSFRINPTDELWPKEEIWSFEAQHALRTVHLSGAERIDPKQVSLPDRWQHFPAYLIAKENELNLHVEHRGDPYPASNQLSIERELWLDFSGNGYTLEDTISGNMKQGWRLVMSKPYQLGRAELNGEAQLVTSLPPSDQDGIEVREGNVRLRAISRIEGDVRHFPASGWEQHFERASARLNLPPGWFLLAATGVDRVQGAWVQRWNLWMIFLVLIIAVSAHKVLGWKWGVVAGLALLMSCHSYRAPIAIWLNLLAIIALLPLLPDGRFKKLMQTYRHVSFILLLFILVPYANQQIKSALYPQLEKSTQQRFSNRQEVVNPQAFSDYEEAEVALDSFTPTTSLGYSRVKKARTFKQYDHAVKVQTGPGLPNWQWRTHSLYWSGPLSQKQTMKLWLLSPNIKRLWHLLELLLVLIFAGGLWLKSYSFSAIKQKLVLGGSSNLVLGALMVGLIAGLSTTPAYADFPPKYLLEDLEQQLTQSPECTPHCVTFSMVRVGVDERELAVDLYVDALVDTVLPLPLDEQSWLPLSLHINGEPTELVYRNNGQLWLLLHSGRHQVTLKGVVSESQQIQLPFPLKPHNIRVDADGWNVSGVYNGQLRGDSLDLYRTKQTVKETSATDQDFKVDIEPFVRIERRLHIGIDWFIETDVHRIAPTMGSFSMKVDLLDGESITSDEVKQEGDQALISFGVKQSSISWRSILPRTKQIQLVAANDGSWYEEWLLNTGTQWHVRYEGLAPVKQTRTSTQWSPRWRPYPGERLTINLVRPTPISGPTITIQEARLTYRPGHRTSESRLELRLLSSQGGDFEFQIPEQANLQEIMIDGVELPIQSRNQQIKLPLVPGNQSAVVSWRTEEKMGLVTTTPRLDLGIPVANMHLSMQVPNSRWPLWVSGPTLGPAVLYWGVFLLVFMIAIAFSIVKRLPIKRYEWVLLGIGMSTSTIPASFLVVVWFFAMAKRMEASEQAFQSSYFNVSQVGLVLLTGAAVCVLMTTIPAGLLWHPNMYISGNGSSESLLQWYQDRTLGSLPQGTLFSLPLWSYRLFMLVWSLWLAFALIRWIKWGWQCFSRHGVWSKASIFKRGKRVTIKAEQPSKED